MLRIFHEEGIRGLYRGNLPNLLLLGYSVSVFCIPLFHTIYFPLYERVKQHFKKTKGWQEDTFKLYAVSAGLSGFFCNVVTNPFWVVRTRMQAEIFRSPTQLHYESTYLSIIHSLQKVFHHVSSSKKLL